MNNCASQALCLYLFLSLNAISFASCSIAETLYENNRKIFNGTRIASTDYVDNLSSTKRNYTDLSFAVGGAQGSETIALLCNLTSVADGIYGYVNRTFRFNDDLKYGNDTVALASDVAQEIASAVLELVRNGTMVSNATVRGMLYYVNETEELEDKRYTPKFVPSDRLNATVKELGYAFELLDRDNETTRVARIGDLDSLEEELRSDIRPDALTPDNVSFSDSEERNAGNWAIPTELQVNRTIRGHFVNENSTDESKAYCASFVTTNYATKLFAQSLVFDPATEQCKFAPRSGSYVYTENITFANGTEDRNASNWAIPSVRYMMNEVQSLRNYTDAQIRNNFTDEGTGGQRYAMLDNLTAYINRTRVSFASAAEEGAAADNWTIPTVEKVRTMVALGANDISDADIVSAVDRANKFAVDRPVANNTSTWVARRGDLPNMSEYVSKQKDIEYGTGEALEDFVDEEEGQAEEGIRVPTLRKVREEVQGILLSENESSKNKTFSSEFLVSTYATKSYADNLTKYTDEGTGEVRDRYVAESRIAYVAGADREEGNYDVPTVAKVEELIKNSTLPAMTLPPAPTPLSPSDFISTQRSGAEEAKAYSCSYSDTNFVSFYSAHLQKEEGKDTEEGWAVPTLNYVTMLIEDCKSSAPSSAPTLVPSSLIEDKDTVEDASKAYSCRYSNTNFVSINDKVQKSNRDTEAGWKIPTEQRVRDLLDQHFEVIDWPGNGEVDCGAS